MKPRDRRRASVERAERLLAADIVLAERRARALECGIECLEDDIEHARRVVRAPVHGIGAPPSSLLHATGRS